MKVFLIYLSYLVFVVGSLELNLDSILEKFINEPKTLFKTYHTLFEKHNHYDINSKEGLRKFNVFIENLEWIKKENKIRGSTVYGFTPFTDMTLAEYKKTVLMDPKEMEKILRDVKKQEPKVSNKSLDLINLKEELDFRPFQNEARDQSACGSCWAFAATAVIEARYNLKFGVLNQLSEQYLLDCDDKDNGCNGGWPSKTFNWVKENGMQFRKDRPYKTRKELCSSEDRNSAINIVSSLNYCEGDCTEQGWFDILNTGPAIIAIDGEDPAYQHYKPLRDWEPLVYTNYCNPPNHAVVASGYKVVNSKILILIRNSWGTNWGYKGYYTIEWKKECNMEQNIWGVDVSLSKPVSKESCLNKYSTNCISNNMSQRWLAPKSCRGFTNSTLEFKGEVCGYSNSGNDYYTSVSLFSKENCLGDSKTFYSSVPNFKKYYFWDNTQTNYKSGYESSFNPSTKCVYVFTDTCFAGEMINICVDIPDIELMPKFKLNSIKSVKFWSLEPAEGDLISIVFFENKNYIGKGCSLKLKAEQRGNYPNLKNSNPDILECISKAKSISLVFNYN